MKVTSLKKFGKYAPGVPFDFPDKAARVMIKVGKFKAHEEAVLTPSSEAERISPATGKPVRQYRRRDMQAED